MQLTVPQRTVADAQSFPTDAEGVSRWLSKLAPTTSISDAMEVYRGLRHSNRLHNDLVQRRAVIACFMPTLRELNQSLLEICQAQPLPLTAEFQRSAQLLDGLLREESFAFKILLADSPQPRRDDLRRAMDALVRQAEGRIHGYRDIPESLLLDAHQLYGLAEEFSLLDANSDNKEENSGDHYRYILLMTLADCRQHRVRQLNPLLIFLKNNSHVLRIEKSIPNETARSFNYAVCLTQGARPVPATSLIAESHKYVRWFSLAKILTRVDAQLAKSRSQDHALLGSEYLDRQSFARLRVSFARGRHRRTHRTIKHESQNIMLGHKAICAHLHQGAAIAINRQAENQTDNLVAGYEAMSKSSTDVNLYEDQDWAFLNHSSQGAMLYSPTCRAGMVQVGELVSMETTDFVISNKVSGKSNAFIAVVRWVIANEGSAIKIGVEYLAKGALPVGISRSHSDDIVADDAMIIACKVKESVLQTILLPAFLYQTGDRLTVTLNKKSRQVKLAQSLQNNGLFSHFSLTDA